ncbi:MAG: hypothetical protein PHO02_03680 [Candidatus Nanoarchaeia archaeon]|nr:hypothetical protein [Candidatus Nanoarchaeia archaeon]
MENNAKIMVEDVRIEILCPFHMPFLRGFRSYEKEMVNFLIEDALDNQNQRISLTFLWFYQDELAAYITLLNDRINLEGNLKEFFMEKGVLYNSLPALKIGRLCVDDRFLQRGMGALMIRFAIKIANQIFERYSGCRFIVLDAKRNIRKSPVLFYEKHGFKILRERKGATPMYFDLVDNIKFCA